MWNYKNIRCNCGIIVFRQRWEYFPKVFLSMLHVPHFFYTKVAITSFLMKWQCTVTSWYFFWSFASLVFMLLSTTIACNVETHCFPATLKNVSCWKRFQSLANNWVLPLIGSANKVCCEFLSCWFVATATFNSLWKVLFVYV